MNSRDGKAVGQYYLISIFEKNIQFLFYLFLKIDRTFIMNLKMVFGIYKTFNSKDSKKTLGAQSMLKP